MSKLILFTGQSNGSGLFIWATTEVPHPDTYMWNGTAMVPPTGAGAIAYCNLLRALLNEPIYVVNACVSGLPLIGPNSWTSGPYAANAIAATQAAMAVVPGCMGVDRVEFIGCNSDCIWPAEVDMYGGTLTGLAALLGELRAGLGDDFRFCVWPVGNVSGGTAMTQVVRAQVVWSTNTASFALGVEIGPASYDRNYSDGNHWADGPQHAAMGRRGAANAASYFVAKANNALSVPHYGAGPQIVGLRRAPLSGGAANRLMVDIAIKHGFSLQTANPLVSASNAVSGFTMYWGVGSKAQLVLQGVYAVGGLIAVDADQGLGWACAVGYYHTYGLGVAAPFYDTRGQPLVQHTSEMMISN
jgi:hypothetical protein